MRTALLVLLLGCSNDKEPKVDASVKPIDAKLVDAAVDAPPDAPPDAPNMNVTTACKHACDAIGVCVGEQPDPSCYVECAEDLADCTAQQVATIDACSTEACGDENNSPLIECIMAVACVEMLAANQR